MLSIVFITFRNYCKFEWFIQSLMHQTDADLRSKIQIIVVDGLLGEREYDETTEVGITRRAYISDTIAGAFEFVHVPPKPTVWQGRWKVTKDNYFAAANTRNTGACYAKYSYIAFHDDLGCPSQSWLHSVFGAKKFGKIQCGAYSKVRNMVVENGKIISKVDDASGMDIRLSAYKSVVSKCEASHFFGSSFCMPLDAFFAVNGMNEMCDGCGTEDYDFGIRLRRQGYEFYYHKQMFIYETTDIEQSDFDRKCIRSSPWLDPADYKSDLAHFLLNYCNTGPTRVNPEFSLRDYHDKIVGKGLTGDQSFLTPTNRIHFFTKRLISSGL